MTICLQSSKLKWVHKALHVASDCAQGGPGGRMKDVRGGDFPGYPVAKTPHAQCRGPGFDLWSGN